MMAVGVKFIISLVMFCVYFVLMSGLLFAVVFTVSRVLTLFVGATGHEIWDFGRWFSSYIKKMKIKKTNP